MKTSRLNPSEPLPLLITPDDATDAGRDLVSIARRERASLRQSLRENGALLFRGFDIQSPAQFSDFCGAL